LTLGLEERPVRSEEVQAVIRIRPAWITGIAQEESEVKVTGAADHLIAQRELPSGPGPGVPEGDERDVGRGWS
jgi:hypothetical protein